MTEPEYPELLEYLLEPEPAGVVVRPLANATPTGSSPGRFPRCIPAAGAPITTEKTE